MRASPLSALLALLPVAASCGNDPPRRPDVVLVVVDTLRADRLHSYGYPRDTSPWIDQLAAEGTLFEDATAQSGWTLPSMVSLLTGRYLTDYRDRIGPAWPTLAEAFQSAGYTTIGTAANVLLLPKSGFDRGFDAYDANPAPRGPQGQTRARDLETLTAELLPTLDEALAEPDRPPLFLYVHPFDPHAPYEEHPQHTEVLPLRDAPPPAEADAMRAEIDRLVPERTLPEDVFLNARRQMTMDRGRYDQEVRETSARLEELFDALRARGVLDHAVVALVSDHGEGLWDHVSQSALRRETPPPLLQLYYQEHGEHLFAEAVHTPFVLWGAGVPAGLRVRDAVENVDLFPTLLDLCDVAAQGELHGRSLVPLLEGDDWESKEAVFSRVLIGESIRDPATGWKRIRPTAAGEQLGYRGELYSLRDDPGERRDVAADHPDVVADLDARLDAWVERHPTVSTFGQQVDPELAEMMGDLGYSELHTGGADEDGDEDDDD